MPATYAERDQTMSSPTPSNNLGGMMNMADQIHAEVRSMIGQSRLTRNSQGIALVHRHDLLVKELLGRGAFSEVHEVQIMRNSTNAKSVPSTTNTTIGYAMKHIKARLLSQPDNFRLAAAELAIEAHMLASFDHPNIMKIRGWAANGVASYTDGRHDSFFLLLDKLDETLDSRINTWQRMMDHNVHEQQELEKQFARLQQQNPHFYMQRQLDQQNGFPLSPGGNIVTDLWRRFSGPVSQQQQLQEQQEQLPQHDQQENFDPIRFAQQQQQHKSQFQQHQVALQQLKQHQQHRFESLQLEKFGICVEIASALAYLHDSGVIFRDLKPNNIGFLNGRVQLFDFGLSRELPTLNLVEPFEMSGKVGTLRYMAVEVACHSEYNVSADVYSWAMVCYEIFTLLKPFAGWTREMHSNLVCGRGIRPEFDASNASSTTSSTNSTSNNNNISQHAVPPAVKQLLEISWHQQAYRRPTMRNAEQRMKQLEEEQLFTVCALDRTKLHQNAPHSFNLKHSTTTGASITQVPQQQLFQAHHQQQLFRHPQLQQLQQQQEHQQQHYHHHPYQPQHPVEQLHHIHHHKTCHDSSSIVELPHNFTVDIMKKPNRNHSETYCTSATTLSNQSTDSDCVMQYS